MCCKNPSRRSIPASLRWLASAVVAVVDVDVEDGVDVVVVIIMVSYFAACFTKLFSY